MNGLYKKKFQDDLLLSRSMSSHQWTQTGMASNQLPPLAVAAFEEVFDNLQLQIMQCFSRHRAKLLSLNQHHCSHSVPESQKEPSSSSASKENIESPRLEEEDECRVPAEYEEGHIKLREVASGIGLAKKGKSNIECSESPACRHSSNEDESDIECSDSLACRGGKSDVECLDSLACRYGWNEVTPTASAKFGPETSVILESIESKITVLGNLLKKRSISKGVSSELFQSEGDDSRVLPHSITDHTLLPFWREARVKLDEPLLRISRRPSSISRAGSISFNRGARSTFSRGPSLFFIEKMINGVSNPVGRPRIIWEGLGTIFIIHDLIMIPLQSFELPMNGGRETFAVIQAVYWTLDIPCCFFVAFHHKGLLENRFKQMAMHYLKTWFCLDVVIVVFDWIIYCFETSDNDSDFKYVKAGRTLRLLRFVRLLRLLRLHAFYSKFLEQVHSEYALTALGVVKLLTLIAFVNHLVACGWYALAEVPGVTWNDEAFKDIDSLGYRYTTSLHWSLTQFTPASMEVFPTNFVERTYTVVVIMVAMVLFSSFISSITEAMTYLRKVNNVNIHQEAALRRYFGDHKVSMVLAMRVWRYLEQSAKARMLRKMWHEVDLLKQLPSNLQMELQMEAYMPTLTKHPFFHHYSEENLSGLREVCHTAVAEHGLLDNQDLFHPGQVCCRMYFLVEGSLSYTKDPTYTSEPIAFRTASRDETTASIESIVVHSGAWFCEAPLFIQWFHEGHMMAKSSTFMLSLDVSAFQKSLMNYCQTLRECCRYAEFFLDWALTHPDQLSDVCMDFDTQLHITQMAFAETADSSEEVANSSEDIVPPNRHSQVSDSTQSSRGSKESLGERFRKHFMWLRPRKCENSNAAFDKFGA